MRTPTRHEAHNGTVTYKVRFRTGGKQTSETFDDEQGADDFCKLMDALGPAAALRYMDDQRDDVEQVPTLDEWAPRHIAALTGITHGTRESYKIIYSRHWSGLLGNLPLDTIDRETVAHALNKLADSDWADKTIRNWHGLLAAIMESAVLAGHIPSSPCKGIRLPRRSTHTDTDMQLLSQHDFSRLLEQIRPAYRVLVLMLAGTGMRWGEATALNVADVDLEAATVQVNKAVKFARDATRGTVGPPKTRRSNRTISLPGQLVEVLRPLVAGRDTADRLFLAPKGGPLRHARFWMDAWEPATRAVELKPRPRIHDLRHSHASWLIEAGVSLPVIQRRLGHESITTTVDLYGHLSPDIQTAAAGAAEIALSQVHLNAGDGPQPPAIEG